MGVPLELSSRDNEKHHDARGASHVPAQPGGVAHGVLSYHKVIEYGWSLRWGLCE
ncbi:hypothetical protein [Pseudomonas sp.]|uniref:hypothetical protein n=1 Tax=Pseudomonas sp. TaxID=306 RepID=UPI002ED81730